MKVAHIFIALFLAVINLKSAYAESDVFDSVTDVDQVKAIEKSFQKSLERSDSNSRVIQCSNVFRFYGHHNHGRDVSYGAHCDVLANGKPKKLFLCDDVMLGKFTVQSNGEPNPNWIRGFIEKNCPPGG